MPMAGCSGGRLDHHMAALGLLEQAARDGLRAIFLDPRNLVEFLLPGSYTLENGGYRYFSLIPVDPVLSELTIRGARYTLSRRDVPRGSSLTVSNEFSGDNAAVSFTGGCCLFIQSK